MKGGFCGAPNDVNADLEDPDEDQDVSWIERVSPTFMCLPKVAYAYAYLDLEGADEKEQGMVFAKIKL